MASVRPRKAAKRMTKHKKKPGVAEQRMRIRLKSPKDVCRYIASCIRRSERGGDETRLYKHVMMASMLIKAIEVAGFDERLSALEATYKQLMERNEHGEQPG